MRATCVIGVLVAVSGCAVRRTTRINPSLVPPQAREAPASELVARVNSWSEKIRTLIATVDFEPTAGSVYSGVIKEYRDVKGFILMKEPALIRIMGQAPIVRTQIFDMVSDGDEFRVYVAPKEKFIVGKIGSRRPAKNALENLRPQHILEALVVPPIDLDREKYFSEEAEDAGRRYYVVSTLETPASGEIVLKRKVWLDRADLEIARQQIYGSRGAYEEEVQYSQYQDFGDVRYPARIELKRPIEDYRLAIRIQKATFNQPIASEKFELKKPDRAQLVDLTAEVRGEPRVRESNGDGERGQ